MEVVQRVPSSSLPASQQPSVPQLNPHAIVSYFRILNKAHAAPAAAVTTQSNNGHGKRKRGPAGGARNKMIEKYMEFIARRGKKLWKPIVIRVPYPKEFVRVRPKLDLVPTVIAEKYPDALDKSIRLRTKGTLVLVANVRDQHRGVHHPPFIGMRFHRVLHKKTQKYLLKCFDALVRAGVPHHAKVKKDNRSATPAWHFGIWSHYRKEPFITRDSRSKKPLMVKVVDKLLMAVKRFVAPMVASLLKEYDPECYRRQLHAHARIKRIMRDSLNRRPAVDFGGAFFTVAIKEGSSELLHVDWQDDATTPTWIIPLGEDWEGADLFCPQLGIRVPIKQGQVFAGLMRRIAHASTPLSKGRRVVLTCFCDRFIMKGGDLTYIPRSPKETKK